VPQLRRVFVRGISAGLPRGALAPWLSTPWWPWAVQFRPSGPAPRLRPVTPPAGTRPWRARLPRPALPNPVLPRLPRPRLRLPRRRLARPSAIAAALAWLLVGLALFTVYLRVSRTVPVDSDGASNALQAWAMLHGNPLLHGWQLSDVSFYTTELPEYLLLEAVRGLRPDVVHLAAALTYTLLALTAAALARGRATGREGALRAALAIGIMLAPERGTSVSVLLLSPDHTGSVLPVLLAWIVLDRAPRRWYGPVLAALLLGWGLVADNIVLITGISPLAAVAAVRGYRDTAAASRPARAVVPAVALAAAAAAAVAAARLALGLLTGPGGFTVWPVGNQLALFGELPGNLMLTLHGILLLFGADFTGGTVGYPAALTAVHLAGIALAGWATAAALRRYAHADLAVQLLAASIVISLAAYLLGRSALDLNSTREFAAVLPLGAALAGRLLAGRLLTARLVPALAVVLTGYLLSLGRVAALPAVPAQGSQLAAWLSAHHLSYGLGGYWQANAVTLATGGRIRVRSVATIGPKLVRDNWETQPSWYDPRLHQANFVVLARNHPGARPYPWITSVRSTLGQPVSVNYVGPYTILVWNKNVLAGLAPGAPAR